MVSNGVFIPFTGFDPCDGADERVPLSASNPLFERRDDARGDGINPLAVPAPAVARPTTDHKVGVGQSGSVPFHHSTDSAGEQRHHV